MNELAQLAVNELVRDKITAEKFESMSNDDRISLALIYAEAAVKRFDRFTMQMQTSPKARETLHDYILVSLLDNPVNNG